MNQNKLVTRDQWTMCAISTTWYVSGAKFCGLRYLHTSSPQVPNRGRDVFTMVLSMFFPHLSVPVTRLTCRTLKSRPPQRRWSWISLGMTIYCSAPKRFALRTSSCLCAV